MVQSIFWNQDHNILAGIQETVLTVWYYPSIVFIDRRLLKRSALMKDTRYEIDLFRVRENLKKIIMHPYRIHVVVNLEGIQVL
jgi:hypothetical protein